jgi:Fe2+ or Zn2+ uptake regulation protein
MALYKLKLFSYQHMLLYNMIAGVTSMFPLKGPGRIIWEALCEGGSRPLGAYEILTKVRPRGVRHAATIYRILHRLEELGWVHRIVSINAFIVCNPSYSGVMGVLICKKCKRVFAVTDPLLGDIIEQLGHKYQFQSEREVIELAGVCRDCRDAAPEESPP